MQTPFQITVEAGAAVFTGDKLLVLPAPLQPRQHLAHLANAGGAVAAADPALVRPEADNLRLLVAI